MWDSYRWWKRGTGQTQKGTPLILIRIRVSDLLYTIEAASSSDKIKVDFHIDATYSDRIPKRVSIVTDTNRKDFLAQKKPMRQRKDDERFEKEVEVMRAAKRLQVLQDSYRRRGIAI